MHRPDGLVRVRNALPQVEDEIAVELGDRVAHRVRDVDRGRALGDDRLEHATQKIRVRSVAVLGRELDIARQVARKPDRLLGLLEHLIGRHAQLFFHVQSTGGQKDVDSRGRAALQGLGGTGDVAIVGPRQ